MGPDRQPLGERAGGERLRPAMAFDGEQGLVLLRCQAGLFRGVLAEDEEPPQQIAELRQPLVVGLG
jgi:hypothetical protein